MSLVVDISLVLACPWLGLKWCRLDKCVLGLVLENFEVEVYLLYNVADGSLCRSLSK